MERVRVMCLLGSNASNYMQISNVSFDYYLF